MKLVTACFTAVFLVSTAATAESLEEKNWHAQQDKNMQLNINAMNQRCGTSITVSTDWSTFNMDDWKGKMNTYPQQAVGRIIMEVCKDDNGKAAVKKEIKSVVVKASTDPARIVLKDGVLTEWMSSVKGGPSAPRQDEGIAYLMKHL